MPISSHPPSALVICVCHRFLNGIHKLRAKHDKIIIISVNKPVFISSLQNSVKCSTHLFQVEKADHCQFLLLYSEDDGICGVHHANKIVERLKQHGCSNYTLHTFPGAGHLLEPPYTPLSALTYHKVFSEYNIAISVWVNFKVFSCGPFH